MESFGEWKLGRQALEDWKDTVRAGKKLDLFALLKREWGFEKYLGESGKGIVMMSRFRSGSAGVGEELARYGYLECGMKMVLRKR